MTVEQLQEQLKELNLNIADSNDIEEQRKFIKERDVVNIRIGFEIAKGLFTPELMMEDPLSETGDIPLDDARELMTEVLELWKRLEQIQAKKRAENSIFARQ